MDNDCPLREICKNVNSTWCLKGCRNNGMNYVFNIFLKRTNIPKMYLNTLLSSMEYSGAGELHLLKYFENLQSLVDQGKGVYLYSRTPGSGKTTFACAILRNYLYFSLLADPTDLENRRSLYLNTPEWLEALRKSMNRPNPELEALNSELFSTESAPKLLLLDDIGAEKPSEWVSERLYSLLNFRVANGLCTIFTSNLTQEEIGAKLGHRIYSRVTGSSKQINLSEHDHRNCDW